MENGFIVIRMKKLFYKAMYFFGLGERHNTVEVLGAYYPGVLGSNLTTGKTNTKLFFRELAGPKVVRCQLTRLNLENSFCLERSQKCLHQKSLLS